VEAIKGWQAPTPRREAAKSFLVLFFKKEHFLYLLRQTGFGSVNKRLDMFDLVI